PPSASSPATYARAAGFIAGTTASSRSRISASAPHAAPLANLRSESPGTNSIERSLMPSSPSLGPPQHQPHPDRAADHLVPLVEAGVLEGDDPLPRPRLARPHRLDLGLR